MISESIASQFSSGSLWLALIGLALATLLSEDLTCIGGGLLVAAGKAPFWPVLGACMVGIFMGDVLLVYIGRAVGRPLIDHRWVKRRVSADSLLRAERWFQTHGGRLVLATRFMPGVRLPAYLAAGILRVPWLPFLGWFALGCVLWTPLLVGGTVWAGESLLIAFAAWERTLPILLVAGVGLWILVKLGLQLATWRGRRLLWSSWRRLTAWEFWPQWAVYPPIVVYILYLGVRYRSFTLFTAANPGIGAGGGVVGESKAQILRGLSAARDRIATWALIEPGTPDQRADALAEFMTREAIPFPVVLKPDVGERGSGVVIAWDEQCARNKLSDDAQPLIAQRYIPGVEFGVFYIRKPSESQGRIFAITDKRMIEVVGDGVHTLEQLILADSRAVCMARFFLEKFLARLDEIPAEGEHIQLTELGTHCRGSLFLDGEALETPALLTSIESVSQSFTGFYFGRYDVRASTVEAF
ncbi:MAG TPA: VTT domain-containing protein, partial [Opitutaceae bacterium]|nr:VTT domain-containing protein [Opitutaceae bacterium]